MVHAEDMVLDSATGKDGGSESCGCSGLDRGTIEKDESAETCFNDPNKSQFIENMVFVKGGKFRMGTDKAIIPPVRTLSFPKMQLIHDGFNDRMAKVL